MRIADVEYGLIGQIMHCWVEIDSEAVVVELREGLNEVRRTLTKVVFPVPDMPMAITQTFLLVLIRLYY
jgi:hypothetical protein